MDSVAIVFEKIKTQIIQELKDEVNDLYGSIFEKDISHYLDGFNQRELNEMLEDLQEKEGIVENIKDLLDDYDDVLLDLEKMDLRELERLNEKIEKEL